MNKELAISILCGDVLGTNEQTHEAVFMAIKALKDEKEYEELLEKQRKNKGKTKDTGGRN